MSLTLPTAQSADTPTPLAPDGGPATAPAPTTRRVFRCRCGRPVFFSNSECLACHAPLGYDPEQLALLPLQPAYAEVADGALADATAGAGQWRAFTSTPLLSDM